MLKFLTSATIAGCSVLTVTSAANAATAIDAAALMSELNLVVLGDADASAINHIEGTAYVGGNLTSGSIYANNRNMPEVTVGDVTGGLIVGGDINANVSNGGQGDVIVGGSVTSADGGVNVTTGATIPVAEMTSAFDTLSANLGNLSDTSGSTFSAAMNFQSFSSGAGDENGTAVLNISYTDMLAVMSNGNQVSFNIDDSVTSFIINVAGTDFTGANALDAGINDAQELVLFNFVDAVDLETTNTWNASILATGADYFNGAGENGTIVVGSLTMGGEIRPYSPSNTVFAGDLSFLESAAPTTPVPVPAALPLAATGLALLGFVGRRRKAA